PETPAIMGEFLTNPHCSRRITSILSNIAVITTRRKRKVLRQRLQSSFALSGGLNVLREACSRRAYLSVNLRFDYVNLAAYSAQRGNLYLIQLHKHTGGAFRMNERILLAVRSSARFFI